jgi:Na+/H+ antiporter NhaD/arsenite permease-like protein
VAVSLLIWVGGSVGAFIDNIPFTQAMIPVVVRIASDPDLGLPLTPLVWALTYGSCLGGNATLIGASANVVAAGLAEQQGYPISFKAFLRIGLPVMVISLAVANVYLLVTHVLIPWY